ncbi:MAG: AAA family ATPase [Candidatus Aenigmarchaeota archaeon]|nr:AAA family ATPase [Candidatus Aenigmarchaeota archaeon]
MDLLSAEESLFINPGVLEQTYLPRTLPYREDQQQYLADCIKPLFEKRNGRNILISGSPGIGKTASIKFLLRKLREHADNIIPVYVNCWKKDTSYKIITEIANQLDIRTTDLSGDQIFDQVISKLNKNQGTVFVFDEIDKTQDHDFLYRVVEDVSFKTIFLITNVPEWIAKLDQRVLSRLMLEKESFRPYNFEETRGILREREKYAFVPNVWEYDAFEEIIKKTAELNDIRSGLFLLKRSGEIAETRASKKIELVDVGKAVEKLKDFYDKPSAKAI